MSNKKNITVIALTVLFILFLGARVKQSRENEAALIPPASGIFAERGQFDVGTKVLVIENEESLPITVWYPASIENLEKQEITYPYQMKMGDFLGMVTFATYSGEATQNASFNLSEGPYPLVILSPGFSIGSNAYAWLAEHLASYGFVVISPEHNEHLDPENELWRSAINRPQDILTVLDFVDEHIESGKNFEGLIDAELVAVIGHSYGGYTSLVAGGAQIETNHLEENCQEMTDTEDPSAWLCDMLLPNIENMATLAGLDDVPDDFWPAWADSRVDAIISMAGDAFFFGESGLAKIDIPVMAIGGTADQDAPFTWSTAPTYEYSSSSRKVEIALAGAEHMIFTASCEKVRWYLKFLSGEFCNDSTWDRNYAHTLTKHFATAFLLSELKQDQNAELALNSENVDLADVSYKAYGY